MNSEWSLDELYKGFDDPKFAADLAKYDEMIAKNKRVCSQNFRHAAARRSENLYCRQRKLNAAFNGHVFICHAAFLREHKGH